MKKLFIILSLLCTTAIHAQLNTDRITAIGRNALYFDDYVLSIQYFNQVIKLKPYLPEPYLLRAIAKIQLSDFNGAIKDCNTALEFNPFQPGIYYVRGFAYRNLEKYDLAEQDFDKALQLSPENRTSNVCDPSSCLHCHTRFASSCIWESSFVVSFGQNTSCENTPPSQKSLHHHHRIGFAKPV